uniref:Uncharacterized protein n=1 Tax=Rhizophora mucronata TaxID=61149 RepID=A0A2P2QRU2_RHIMU
MHQYQSPTLITNRKREIERIHNIHCPEI